MSEGFSLPLSNRAIAEEWRRDVMSSLAWTMCENQAGAIEGEAGGYFVQALGFHRRAYLKPAKAHSDALKHARAAREKIASDLAHDLGLCVPPAQLTIRTDPPPGSESSVVISLVLFERQWPWQQVKGQSLEESIAGAALARALASCSPLLAFNTWLQQTDHNDHPHNIVWGYDPSRLAESQLVFLDYANSMGFDGSWENNKWRSIEKSPFPKLMSQAINEIAVLETANKIAEYPDDAIATIVNRIPESHLDSEQRSILRAGLIGRKKLLRNVFTAPTGPASAKETQTCE